MSGVGDQGMNKSVNLGEQGINTYVRGDQEINVCVCGGGQLIYVACVWRGGGQFIDVCVCVVGGGGTRI